MSDLTKTGFDHPCKQTCSGWEQGRERGYHEGQEAAFRVVVDKDFILNVITEWKNAWMNVQGTDERDQKNYRLRAFGVDANMKHDLAKRIVESIENKQSILKG